LIKIVLKTNNFSCERETSMLAKCREQVFASPKKRTSPFFLLTRPNSASFFSKYGFPHLERGRTGSRNGTKKTAELSASAYSYCRSKSCKTTLFVPNKPYRERVQSSVYREPSGVPHALEGKAEA
jgi:hypothetical protein